MVFICVACLQFAVKKEKSGRRQRRRVGRSAKRERAIRDVEISAPHNKCSALKCTNGSMWFWSAAYVIVCDVSNNKCTVGRCIIMHNNNFNSIQCWHSKFVCLLRISECLP